MLRKERLYLARSKLSSTNRRILFVLSALLTLAADPAQAHDVLIPAGLVRFVDLDGSPEDHDGLADGVFSVDDGNLTIEGTITCDDAAPLAVAASACAIQLNVSGDVLLGSRAFLIARNLRGAGNGGNVSISAGGDIVLAGRLGTKPGARILTSRLSTTLPGTDKAGDILLAAGGDLRLLFGSIVSANAARTAGGNIDILAGGQVVLEGLVASGPSSAVLASKYTARVLGGATPTQSAGPITVIASGLVEPGITVGSRAVVVSQGEALGGSGAIRLEACGIVIRGLVAAVSKIDDSQVTIRSGQDILVEGQDLGTPTAPLKRFGRVRADFFLNGPTPSRALLLAQSGIQVLGATRVTPLYSVTSNAFTGAMTAGSVLGISLNGDLTAAGAAFQAGLNKPKGKGGLIDLGASGDITLDTARLVSWGGFPSASVLGVGGTIQVRSYQGGVSWLNGTGDVRPSGPLVAPANQGTIEITYATVVDLTGSRFFAVNSPDLVPTLIQDGSVNQPPLPVGETAPQCGTPAVAVDDAYAATQGVPLSIAAPGLLANDSGATPLAATDETKPTAQGGTVDIDADGSFTYTPPSPTFAGSDSFDYTVTNAAGSDTGSVALTVTDAAPSLVLTSPVDGSTAATNANLVLTFSEPVDVAGDWFQIVCGTSGTRTVAQTAVSGGPTTFTIDPVADFAEGESCTVTVAAVQVTDQDASDPPNTMAADASFAFQVDVAPTVIATTPANGATDVPLATNLSVQFSEPVDVNGNWFQIACGTSGTRNVTDTVVGGGPTLFTIDPLTDFVGVESCTLTVFAALVTDQDANDPPNTIAANQVFTFSTPDTLPTAVNDAAVVNEDSGANALAVLANDTDPDGGPKTIISATDPANGTVVITGGGTGLTYAPDANYCNNPPGTTPDTFSYTLNGGSTATVTVTVNCVDDGPAGVNDAATVTEDSAATAIDVLANDTDVDGGTKTIVSAGDPANGTVVITGGGTALTYAPDADYCNNPPGTTPDTFTYTLNGGSTATVSVTVTCVADDPTAVNDTPTVAEDSGATAIDVLANDTDPDAGPKSIASASDPANGTVVITGGGTGLTYAPDANYCNNPPGTTPDTFTYTLTPGGSVATVSVTVTCVDDPPVAVDDAATVAEDSGATAIGVLGNDTDSDGGPKTISSTSDPANGTVVITGGGTGLTYAPDANYCNAPPGTTPDTFSYTLNGGSIATVSVTVTCVNDAPVAVDDALSAVLEDSGTRTLSFVSLLANDSKGAANESGQSLTITGVANAVGGSVAIVGTDVLFAPTANYFGPASFDYTIQDDGTTGGAADPRTDVGQVSFTVTAVNDAPSFTPANHTSDEDAGGQTAAAWASSPGPGETGQTLTFFIDGNTNPSLFSAGPAVSSAGVLTYTAAANQSGTATITVHVQDDGGTANGGGDTSAGQTFSITVNAVNDAPVAQSKSYSAQANMQVTGLGGLLTGVTDADSGVNGCTPTFSVASLSVGNGTVSNLNAGAGSFDFEPNPGFTGNATGTYTVQDNGCPGNATSAAASVTITVGGPVIWFVDDSAPGGGDGRLGRAFQTMGAATSAIGASTGHRIFVYSGTYTQGATLNQGGWLIGQGVSTAGFDGVMGITPPAGTIVRPQTRFDNGSLARPSLGGTVTLGTSSQVRGLNVSSGTATGFTATGRSSLATSEVSVSTSTGTAVSLSSSDGTLAFTSVSSNGAVNGILLSSTTGSFTVTGDGTSARNGSGGTITGSQDDAIALTSAQNVTLQSMNLTSNGNTPPAGPTEAQSITGDQTLQISGGSNVVLSGVLIQNPIGTGILALNLGGTNRVSGNSRITQLGATAGHALYVNNTNTNMTLFEFTNSQILDSASVYSAFFFGNNGSSNVALDVKGSTFEDLATQAVTVAAGATSATTGTLTSTIGGPNAADRNLFQNAKGLGENNLAVLANLGAIHTALVENNLFDNVAEDGSIANTSVIRTQNNGGRLTATVRNNDVQNINYATGGRHVIGHIFEPPVYTPSDRSELTFEGNTVTNVTYTLSAREFIFVDYRAFASGGKVRILNNSFDMASPGSQQMFELRFRQANASTVDLRVDGNVGTGDVSGAAFVDIDAEASATVNATVTGNNFTNTNGAPGMTVDFASEAVGASSLCANVSGNTLEAGVGRIAFNQTGNLRVTQTSAASVASLNGIPGANVTVAGAPAFAGGTCPLP